jgi:hypothetical protein
MEGILLFCVLGAEIFTRHRLEIRLLHARPWTQVPTPPVAVRPAAHRGGVS